MRKLTVFLCVLLFATALVAQQRTGNIEGVVKDTEGNLLPGATVTLLHGTVGATTAVTSSTGVFRFPSLFPAFDYGIKVELAGFKTKTFSGIIVVVGDTTRLNLTLEQGAIEEQVTVVATSPVIDTKKTSVSQTVNYETLQSMPSARDPWVVLQMVPSIQVDRENVGGNESGQQASYVALGGGTGNGVWSMDGVIISDPAAIGASPSYYDFDVFEEMNITVGGADVEVQTGGVALNMITRRGGNKLSFAGRFYLTDQKFQATPSGATYEALKKIFGAANGYNRIRDIKDYGFNIGGPILKDKIWWWGAYGIQEIKTNIITGAKDETFLTNLAAKVNLNLIRDNRFEAFIHAGKKEKFGRSSSTQIPLGLNQRGKYHFGSPIIKLQDEHTFGENFFVSVKFGFTDAGFGLWPAEDPDLTKINWYDVANGVYRNNYTWFFSGRPNYDTSAQATYYNDKLLGASHEIKFGVEYVTRGNSYVSGWPSNLRVWNNYNTATVDFNGNGTRDIVLKDFGVDLKQLRIYRGSTFGGNNVKAYVGYISDTVTMGRLSLKLGLRYDKQVPSFLGFVSDSLLTASSDDPNLKNYFSTQQAFLPNGVADKIRSLFPGTKTPAIPSSQTKSWNYLSPRIGLTYDLFGNGKTLLKASFATYGGFLGTYGWLWAKQGGGGNIQFWWWDKNGSKTVDSLDELYWAAYNTARTMYPAFDSAGNFVGNWDREENLMWWGYDPQNPTQYFDSRYHVQSAWTPDRTIEAFVTLEREILPDLGVAVDVTWRKYDNFWRSARYVDEIGGKLLSKDDFMVAGVIPANFVDPATGKTISTGDAGGKNWYVWKDYVKDIYDVATTTWSHDRWNEYRGIDIRVNKRLSNKWMMNGSFTFQSQIAHYGKNGYEDPTSLWAIDGKPYAYSVGGASGKIDQPVFSTWMFKVQGLYQLPWDLDVSLSFNARQGHIVPSYVAFEDDTNLPNPASTWNQTYTKPFGASTDRLPTFYDLNLRLEKRLRMADVGNIYIMADVFNTLNSNILNRKYAYDLGTYYVDTGAYSPAAHNGEPNEVLNPLVVRFGVRFQF
jgi:hypothetical protein